MKPAHHDELPNTAAPLTRAALIERLDALEQNQAPTPEAQIHAARQCVQAAERLNFASGIKRVLGLLAGCELEVRNFETGTKHCIELLRRASKGDDLHSRVWVLMLLGLALERARLYQRALGIFRIALRLSEQGYPRMVHEVHGHIGNCLEALGQNLAAHAALRRELAGYTREEVDVARAMALAKLALNQAIAGNAAGALVLLEQARELDRSSGTPQTAIRMRFYAGATYDRLGQMELAHAELQPVVQATGERLNLSLITQAHDMLARIALTRGNASEALQHLDAAQAGHRTLLVAAQDVHLDAVYHWVRSVFDAKAAEPDASTAPKPAADLPPRVPQAALPPSPAGSAAADAPLARALSAKESRVLEFVVAGLSNAAIAERLGVSPNTVRFHVSSVLTKLGAKRRAEAAAIAVRSGLVRSS
jgi:DNA-binding NarL/FixJ family response regulator